jgi:thiosulfate/3-mercaptopyruvate sulfurtransferase
MRCLTILLALSLPAASACGGHGDPSTMLVTTGWLADHLHDKNLVILSVGNKAEYDEAHIPGALYVDYMDTHVMKDASGLTLELAPDADMAKLFGDLGIGNDSRIVLYKSKDGHAQVTRVYLTLDALGLAKQTSILDGGYPVWKSENRPVTKDVPKPVAKKLQVCPQDDVIASLDYVKSHMHAKGVAIVDARLADFYTGAKIPGDQRAGHIPGAVSIPFTSVIEKDGKLKSADALRQEFTEAGIKPGDRVVTYCHIGQQATQLYFVARLLGYDARLFDGSWEDWSRHKELPAETSTK